MIKKLDKKYLWMIIAFVSAVVLIGGVYLYSSSNIQPDHQKEFNQTSKTSSSSKEKAIDLSGEYVSSARDKAKIQKDGKSWKIDYETEDGPVSATFSTDFKVEGANKVSTSQMKKSDGNTDFTVTVRIFKYKSDKDSLITVTMSDKDPDHEMVFANRKDFFKSTDPDDDVLDGDLTTFEGTYTNNYIEKMIADSGFKLYGYSPEDFYNHRTTVFPYISSDKEKGWIFWSGATNVQFVLNKDKKPRKAGSTYQVYFVQEGTKGTSPGQELIMTLIPENVQGPDGVVSPLRRIFYHQASFQTYQDKWWEAYPAPKKEVDLDISAINSGDFSSLVGTWRNAKGQEMVIQADGTVKGQGRIKAVANSDKTSKIPYVELRVGETGAAVGLFKIGFENPDGDQSDTSKPRLVVTQSAGNYSADQYFYRQ
ncbi:DUF6287 domain-containing protein [Streptococcus rubneri]|uniref:DUF6287 domain-containing protein n=1 Tax=Streptococcus rubneri TaxID=1234680 RepID=UPI00321A37D1